MTRDRLCSDHGLLVDGGTRLATDVCEYYDARLPVLVGCGRLRCENCDASVRSAPQRAFREGVPVDVQALYAAANWDDLPFIEERKPVLRDERPVRLYSCKCRCWLAERVDAIDNEHDSESDPNVPWTCGAHPVPRFPLTLGSLTLEDTPSWADVVSTILGGGCPRDLELPHKDGDGPSVWLGWLYVYLAGLPAADALSSAIAARLDDAEPLVVGRVLHFFSRFPRAAGVERVIAQAESRLDDIAIGYPIPEYGRAVTRWDVLIARLEQHEEKRDVLDARADALLRRALVMPLSSLSHDNRGSTDLVECERQLRARQGWDSSGEFAQDWFAKFAILKAAERVDVVANELARGSTAFRDADMRLFIADHIVAIDAAAPGRWRHAMSLLSDWYKKPELGHLIVIAGMRVIEAGLAAPDEFRDWIESRRAYGWVDDAWVLPLETMLQRN